MVTILLNNFNYDYLPLSKVGEGGITSYNKSINPTGTSVCEKLLSQRPAGYSQR